MTLNAPLARPASITDDLLERLTAQVVATGGDTWKLTEVYTGEVITALPQSTPGDIETAFAEFEDVMFRRSAAEATAARETIELIFGAGAPDGLVNLFNGTDEEPPG